MNHKQIICLVTLAIAGLLHAQWIVNWEYLNQLGWHLSQWIPMLLGAGSYWLYAVEVYKNREGHSLYGQFGISAVAFVIPGIFYVIGLHYIWRY